ncbi:MAG: response regulator, partial [Paracoccus sp. (in: a-proteobacteria)]|nr:response regulator [Paracoccus sp. (in: a-proteobacteria)]
LAVFQQTILSVRPPDQLGSGLRILPDDRILPDSTGLREDLAHVAEVLAGAEDTAPIDYIARFLAGVARSAHDPDLAEAAAALARDHEAGNALAVDLARVSGMVQDRLDRVAEI